MDDMYNLDENFNKFIFSLKLSKKTIVYNTFLNFKLNDKCYSHYLL